MIESKIVVRDGMRIIFDAPIMMDDGLVLRADVFLPVAAGRYPVILSHGPYAKGLAFQEKYAAAWDMMVAIYPDVAAGSSNLYQNWEVVDPEKWVPDGYAVVRVDCRGCGRSPGYLDLLSAREMRDFHDCIEWAGVQDWSTGKVGLSGISYYATNQWLVAALQPPHLAAICPWEGYADRYREATYHGGIPCEFSINIFKVQMKTVQHGLGERGARSRVTGELVAGPETLSDEELERNRFDMVKDLGQHTLADDYHRARSADWSRVNVPILSCGNWGGQPLHPRGNYEGFMRAASDQKWLEVHGGPHWAVYYTDYANDLQKRFFGHFLKGEDTGWDQQPPVQLNIRHPGERFELRHEAGWPIPRTCWTQMHFDPVARALATTPAGEQATVAFEAMGDGLTFMTPPLLEPTEITGPVAAKLWVSSSTPDADLFLVLRVLAPDDEEVTFQGALDPHTPIGQGWLRASHRKLSPDLSLPYRPYHTHDEVQPLIPGEPVELDIEIHPTCIVVPAGYRVALSVLGRDYEWAGESKLRSVAGNVMRGCGPFIHEDRDPAVYGGTTTVHFGPERPAWVMLPIIPPA